MKIVGDVKKANGPQVTLRPWRGEWLLGIIIMSLMQLFESSSPLHV